MNFIVIVNRNLIFKCGIEVAMATPEMRENLSKLVIFAKLGFVGCDKQIAEFIFLEFDGRGVFLLEFVP